MPSAPAVVILRNKLLLVEGKDEVNFFTAVLGNHLRLTSIQVIDYGGKSKFASFLRTLAADPAFPTVTCIGVIRDADQTRTGSPTPAAASAFDAIRGALTAPLVQLPCPTGHGQFTGSTPRIGVFILPDGSSDGMLETLCIQSVASQPEYRCVTDFFTCCQACGAVPNNIHKARAHTWLASRPDPDKRLGEAALAGYWPFHQPTFHDLWSFLQAM